MVVNIVLGNEVEVFVFKFINYVRVDFIMMFMMFVCYFNIFVEVMEFVLFGVGLEESWLCVKFYGIIYFFIGLLVLCFGIFVFLLYLFFGVFGYKDDSFVFGVVVKFFWGGIGFVE